MINLHPVQSPTEIELVASLAEVCWHWHYTGIIGQEQVTYMLDQFQSSPSIHRQIGEGREYHLIEDATQEPHGYLACDLQADHLFLSKLYILPSSQRRGLGKQALTRLVELHPALDIRLTVNKHNHTAIAFYERNGFTKEGPVVADIGNGYVMDDWKMLRKADSST